MTTLSAESTLFTNPCEVPASFLSLTYLALSLERANPLENLYCAGKNNLTNSVCLQYDGTEHSRRITKEMQNCVDEKSILAVLEQIHSKLPMEQRKLWETVGDETKVGGSEKK